MSDSVGTDKRIIFDGDFEFYELNISNTHGANSLSVSFDGGTKWRTITFGEDFTLRGFRDTPIKMKEKLYVKGSGASTTFEITILKKGEDKVGTN